MSTFASCLLFYWLTWRGARPGRPGRSTKAGSRRLWAILALVAVLAVTTWGAFWLGIRAGTGQFSPGSSAAPGSMISTLTPTLSWSSSPGATGYALTISVAEHGWNREVYRHGALTGTSVSVPPGVLTAGRQYRWTLQAYNSAGWSPVSSSLYFQTLGPAPPPPSLISATASLTSVLGATPGIDIQWTPSTGATWYDLYRDGVFYRKIEGFENALSFMVRDGGLTTGQTYFYYVVARNASGSSGPSNTLSCVAP